MAIKTAIASYDKVTFSGSHSTSFDDGNNRFTIIGPGSDSDNFTLNGIVEIFGQDDKSGSAALLGIGRVANNPSATAIVLEIAIDDEYDAVKEEYQVNAKLDETKWLTENPFVLGDSESGLIHACVNSSGSDYYSVVGEVEHTEGSNTTYYSLQVTPGHDSIPFPPKTKFTVAGVPAKEPVLYIYDDLT